MIVIQDNLSFQITYKVIQGFHIEMWVNYSSELELSGVGESPDSSTSKRDEERHLSGHSFPHGNKKSRQLRQEENRLVTVRELTLDIANWSRSWWPCSLLETGNQTSNSKLLGKLY